MRRFRSPRYAFRSHVVPTKGDPLVRMLFAEANHQRVSLPRLAEMSGVSRHTIDQWRYEVDPKLDYVQRCLNALGYDLVAVPKQREVDAAIEQARVTAAQPIAWVDTRPPLPPLKATVVSHVDTRPVLPPVKPLDPFAEKPVVMVCAGCGTQFVGPQHEGRVCAGCRTRKTRKAA